MNIDIFKPILDQFLLLQNASLCTFMHLPLIDIQAQKMDAASTLNTYKRLVKLRREDAFQKGSMVYNTVDQNIFSFVRCCREGDKYLVVINFGYKPCAADCSCPLFDISYKNGTVVIDTACHDEKTTQIIDIENIHLEAGQAKVILLVE